MSKCISYSSNIQGSVKHRALYQVSENGKQATITDHYRIYSLVVFKRIGSRITINISLPVSLAPTQDISPFSSCIWRGKDGDREIGKKKRSGYNILN